MLVTSHLYAGKRAGSRGVLARIPSEAVSGWGGHTARGAQGDGRSIRTTMGRAHEEPRTATLHEIRGRCRRFRLKS
jgi:hypothetical protein